MFKKLLIAASLAGACVVSAQVAEAKVKIYIGEPGGYCYNHYDPYRCGGGYQGPGFYDPYPPRTYDDYDDDYDRFSCGDAREMLRDRGYHNIRANSCGGRYYVFTARKHHKTYLIKVSSRSGEIRSIQRI